MSRIESRLKEIQGRIAEAARRVGRDPAEVQLVAAAKGVPPERIVEAVDAGVGLVGENYVQEAQRAREAVDRPVRWHLIGHLQSNKVRQAVRLFDVIETVDRPKIVSELERQAGLQGRRLEVLVQVNLSGEVTKSGAAPEDVPALLEALAGCEHLRCIGLMTLPPRFDDPEGARPYFAELRRLRDDLRERLPAGGSLEALSMGMSGDFEAAVEEGATWVRIGTALFGPRGG